MPSSISLTPHGLTSEGYAEIDLFVIQAKASTAGDYDGAVVERVVRFRDAATRTRGRRIDLGRAFHSQGFVTRVPDCAVRAEFSLRSSFWTLRDVRLGIRRGVATFPG